MMFKILSSLGEIAPRFGDQSIVGKYCLSSLSNCVFVYMYAVLLEY